MRLSIPLLLLTAACGSDRGSRADSAKADTLPPAASRPPSADGRECRIAPVTGGGIGDVMIGMSEADLRARCTVTSDTTVPGPEGQTSRRLGVAMGGETVDVEIADGKVWRIPVTLEALRTADSLGVGTPLARLLDLPGVTAAMGEGTYVMAPSHCGISFQLRNPRGPLPPAQSVDDLRRLPAGVVVERMLVVGCNRTARDP